MPDPAERRFTDDEARAIIERAARTQHALEVRDDARGASGLSLAELQEVARAAGLDPRHVAAAAASLEIDGATPPVDRFGVPTRLRITRVVPAVSDPAWELMVAALRAEFGTAGSAGQVGRMREWTGQTKASSGLQDEVHVVAAPHAGGVALTIEQADTRRRGRDMLVAAGTTGGMGVLFLAMGLVPGAPIALAVLGGAVAGIGGLFGVGGVVHARRWATGQERRFHAVLDRLEVIARTT